jgi:hypothetical protein
VLAALVLCAVTSCASGTLPASTGSTTWWHTTGTSACGSPAMYRVNDGSVSYAGDCAGNLLIPPPTAMLAVGGQIDVHMVEEGSGPTGTHLVPVWPIPSSSNQSILRVTSVTDGGSTETFLAVGGGTTDLVTKALCVDSPTSPSTNQPCPVLQVVVS